MQSTSEISSYQVPHSTGKEIEAQENYVVQLRPQQTAGLAFMQMSPLCKMACFMLSLCGGSLTSMLLCPNYDTKS